MLIIFVLQIIFLTFTGPAIRVVRWGLDPLQWLLCIGFGMLVVVFDFIIKFIPMQKLFKGLGSTMIKKENFKTLNTLSIKKKHESLFFKRGSALLSKNSLVSSTQKL